MKGIELINIPEAGIRVVYRNSCVGELNVWNKPEIANATSDSDNELVLDDRMFLDKFDPVTKVYYSSRHDWMVKILYRLDTLKLIVYFELWRKTEWELVRYMPEEEVITKEVNSRKGSGAFFSIEITDWKLVELLMERKNFPTDRSTELEICYKSKVRRYSCYTAQELIAMSFMLSCYDQPQIQPLLRDLEKMHPLETRLIFQLD